MYPGRAGALKAHLSTPSCRLTVPPQWPSLPAWVMLLSSHNELEESLECCLNERLASSDKSLIRTLNGIAASQAQIFDEARARYSPKREIAKEIPAAV